MGKELCIMLTVAIQDNRLMTTAITPIAGAVASVAVAGMTTMTVKAVAGRIVAAYRVTIAGPAIATFPTTPLVFARTRVFWRRIRQGPVSASFG